MEVTRQGGTPVIGLDVYSVLYSLLSRHRIVLLKEMSGERFLPIWIGQHEAEAIAMRLQETSVPRPLTHDTLLNIIGELGGVIQHIVINDLNNGTFYARIAVEHDGELRLVDSRPSDAIALAVRALVPIYAEESVMAKAGIAPSPEIVAVMPQKDDDLDVFRDFVNTLGPDNMGE
jgi:bifunctional DNase/RNase